MLRIKVRVKAVRWLAIPSVAIVLVVAMVATGLAAQGQSDGSVHACKHPRTGVITIVDSPEGSVEPRQRVWLAGFLGALLGLMLSGTWALAGEFFERDRKARAPEYQELDALRAVMLRNVSPRRMLGTAKTKRGQETP